MTRKLFIFFTLIFAIIGFFISFNHSESYDDKTTHPALTDEMVDFYNSIFLEQLTPEEKEWIVQGSIDEDIPPRWVNHFYDPIYNEGWQAENLGRLPDSTLRIFSVLFLNSSTKVVSSKDWVHDELLQTRYAGYGGNNTWENALREYQKGNKKEAYYILGHILHLLEDSTVPDHTRNDTHAHEGSSFTQDGGSPYEDYGKNFNRENLTTSGDLQKLKKEPVVLGSIDEYFDKLAGYSNGYFFSEDTINDKKYSNPKIIREYHNYGYGEDKEGKDLFLVRREETIVSATGEIIIDYTLRDVNDVVLSSYFSRLSQEAVMNGAGAIKLFHDEAEMLVKGEINIPPEPKLSWRQMEMHSPLYGAVAMYDQGKNTVVSIINAFQNVALAAVDTIYQVGSSIRVFANNTTGLLVSPLIKQPMNTRMSSVQVVNQIDQDVAPVSDQQTEEQRKQENQIIKQPETVQQSAKFIVGNDVPTVEFAVSSTADIVKKEATPTHIVDMNDDQTTTTTEIATSTLAVASQGGGWASAYIPNEPLEDSNDITDFLNATSTDETSSSTEDFITATSTEDTATSTEDIPTATTTIDIFSIFQAPIVINEIAWMGTKVSANDEWVELYNKTDYEVDLTGWTLENSNNLLIKIEGKISPKGYFLLERTASTTTDILENQIYTGAMNNSGAGADLYLKRPDGEVMDFVSQWYAGNNTEKRSMERTSANGIGDQSFSWATFSGTPFSKDAEGNDVLGTPGAQNSVLLAYTPVSGDIATSTVWRKIESPYRIVGDVNVLIGADLKIDPGVVIQMPSVSENGDFAYPLDVNGILNAQGTENEKIIFQGGFGSIRFLNANAATSTLGYFEMNSGGQGKPVNWFSKDYKGAIYAENSHLAMSSCNIENSTAFGIFLNGLYNFDMRNCRISGTSQIRMIELNDPWVYGYGIFGLGSAKENLILRDNIFENNAEDIFANLNESADISIENNTFSVIDINGTIDDNLVMTGNSFRAGSRVYLSAGLQRDFIFQKGVDYYIRSFDVREATLKIEPGVSVYMDRDSILAAHHGAVLDFSGTEAEKIYFVGARKIDPQGRWRGIVLKNNARAIFNNVEFNNGGTNSSAAVLTIEGGDASILNSLFNDSRMGVHILGNEYGHPINLNITRSTFAGSKYQSVLKGVSGATVSISDSNIFPSYYTDVNINKYPAFESYALESISMEGNWWGDVSGPYHEILNPDGLGAKIAGNVDFAPWSESEF